MKWIDCEFNINIDQDCMQNIQKFINESQCIKGVSINITIKNTETIYSEIAKDNNGKNIKS